MISTKNTLVCITKQKTCERLIKNAVTSIRNQNIRNQNIEHQNSELFVIHVVKNEWKFLNNPREGEALEYLFGISKSVGATLTVLRSDDIIQTISDFTVENNIGTIFLGESPNDNSENSFNNEIHKKIPNIELIVVSSEKTWDLLL